MNVSFLIYKSMEELQKKEYEPTKEEIILFDKVCDYISLNGSSVRKACEVLGLNRNIFNKVLYNANIEYSNQYARAQDDAMIILIEDTIDLFDKVPDTIDVGGRLEQNNIGLGKAKAKADKIQWFASKLSKRLSDKGIQVNTQINTNQPVQIVQPTNINQDINRLLGNNLQNDTKNND